MTMFCKKFSVDTVGQPAFCVRHGRIEDGDPRNFDDNKIFIPLREDGEDDGAQRLYVCVCSYRIVLRLTSADTPLYTQLPAADSGTLCITLRDKGAADDMSQNPNKYESVYFKKVKEATSGMDVHDTILAEKAFVLSDFANAIYSIAPMLQDPYEIVVEDTPHHPIYYPLPLDRRTMDEFERQTMTVDLYLKMTREDPTTGSDHIYIPLHRGILTGDKTTAPSIVARSDVQLLVCNDTYLDVVDQHTMDRSGRHLLGTVNTRMSDPLTSTFPHRVDFGNVAARSDNKQVTRQDLELPIGSLWEIGLTRVTYISPEDNKTVLIPKPGVAKSLGTYDLYAGELMIGPAMMFPCFLESSSGPSHTMSDVFKQMWDGLPNAGMETSVNDNFGVMYYMFVEIASRYPKTLTPTAGTERDFYSSDYDLMTTYSSSETIKRSPFFRWNYLDTWYRDNPSEYTLYGGDYALMSPSQLVTHKPITATQFSNAQSWASNTMILGWRYRTWLVGRGDWGSVEHAQPTLELIETGGDSTLLNRNIRVKLTPRFSTGYLAMGNIMRTIFGFQQIKQTPQILDRNTGGVLRKSLSVVYSHVTDSYVAPCQLVAASSTSAPMAPHPWVHRTGQPVPTTGWSKTYLWYLPKLDTYSVTSSPDYYYFANKTPKPTLSTSVLNPYNCDDIFLYCNLLPNTRHIGDHLSPLLAQIPCPSHKMGLTRDQVALSSTGGTILSKTYEIENPVFSALESGCNLDDMRISVTNSYGDLIYTGILELHLTIREKETQNNT